ncbi:MAG: beta-L-arabinofuranosidase domain-containing protein [Kiritimatiellales bacterium]
MKASDFNTCIKTDQLVPGAHSTVQISGWLGEKLNLSQVNRVMSQDLELILRPYRERFEENDGHWRCEYWGKWVTSAVLGCSYQPDETHFAVLDRAVKGLLATQTPDGHIGTYKDSKHLGIWDVWGRKYTLLGLIAAYDLTGDEEALAAARRVADHLLTEAPPGQFNLAENGMDLLKGLSSSSILEPLALLYQRTGGKRYLELAEDIVANWSKPNKFFSNGQQLIEQAFAKIPPEQIGSQKSYEMMSCFEGLCELYRIRGEQRYLDAAVEFAQTLRRTELMIHGSGSNKELWCGGTRIQTEILEQPMETCVTVTWMKLCYQLLRLTGDSLWADELEVSLYNALIGAMTPDGSWWAYFSPLAGQRVPSHYQHEDVKMSCCVANGPRGLLLTPRWAVMTFADGLAVNLYASGDYAARLNDGVKVRLTQQTEYPVADEITLTVNLDNPAVFTLKLRIPAWSKHTSLSVNGEPVDCQPGSYAALTRKWVSGDKVFLNIDLRGRVISAPSGAPQFAVMRGPVVLALDDRLAKPQDIAVRLAVDEEGFVPLKPIMDKPAEVWMAFEVPFDVKPLHYIGHYQTALIMCDYASAGNRWSSENLFRVWLPQPLFLRHMYPEGTWRLMCPGLTECPTLQGCLSGNIKRNDFPAGKE